MKKISELNNNRFAAEAGMHLWKMILDDVRNDLGKLYLGDLQAPEFIIHSIPQLG
ncbi:MAG: hypothetical protein IPO37_04850 [Saprospiraceae bacterium]|nr:hypothetical protein [Saprospiraceae bacterium]